MTRRIARSWVALLCVPLVVSACATIPAPETRTSTSPTATSSGPRWDHVVVVIMGSRSYQEIIENRDAPFVNFLRRTGVSFTDAHAVTHPAQPNYLALFSGATQGVRGNACPQRFDAPNLAGQLRAHDHSFIGYAESLPRPGFTGCRTDPYATTHNPWVAFPALPKSINQPAGAVPRDFAKLPDVAFVVPNIYHAMSAGTIGEGDDWLRQKFTSLAAWVSSHNSLLIITWDQASGGSEDNRTALIAVGAHVARGTSDQPVDHYQLLATLQDAFGLSRLANSIAVDPITALDA